jgi:hypothetical protein
MKLLTTGNPKILKGQKKGYLSFILHLAPAKLSGYQVCASSTEGCRAACLNTAGRGGMFAGVSTKDLTGAQEVERIKNGTLSNVIQSARIARTRMFFEHREMFLSQLVKEIRSGIQLAQRKGLTPVFRLNGTSDVRWEHIAIGDVPNVMLRFPSIQFYDYTKHANRKNLPSNYHLTFSLAESNDVQAEEAMANGMNVAAVFRKTLPSTFKGRPVINGDESDLRFLDGKGVIVGLKAKGKGKKDLSGFVHD